MDILNNNDSCEFACFFKKLGYTYSWDFSKKDGLYWHELYNSENECVLQVDMSVDLNKIIQDMCIKEDFDCGYFIATSSQKEYEELCQKVRRRRIEEKVD